MVFTEALAAAANIMFDRHLLENVTDLRAGSKWEGNFKRFHTAMRHRIVFGDYRDKIHHWKHYFLFCKDKQGLEPLRRARPSSALKGKFKALRELSHQIWPEVVEELERKKKEKKEKKERKSKPAVSATPLSGKRFTCSLVILISSLMTNFWFYQAAVKPPRSKMKPMGLKKRAPVYVDDSVVASKLAPESPKPKDSLSLPLPSSSIASQTK
ncbi:unnamed protein product [Microthlaspi erraticum]|nr:unnamed protein product [Microthlaspi erraticum]